MPIRKYLCGKLLPEKCKAVYEDIKSKLQRAPSVYLTMDLWTSRDMRSFMGVTGHFIIDYVLQSVMFGCRRFYGSHRGEAIRTSYQEILGDFEIADKVTIIVTDSASIMVKAFSLPGYVITNDLEVYEGEEDDKEDLEPLAINIEDSDDVLCHTDVIRFFPERVLCFSHTLQLVVKDGLKESGQLKTVISKASSLVAHIRKSHLASELLEKCNRLQTANATRWNSQLKMLRRVLNVPSDIMDKIDFANKPTAHEIKLMYDLCAILKPFEKATNASKGQNVVYSSQVIIIIRTLREELDMQSRDYNCRLLSTLKHSVDSRLSKYEHKDRLHQKS